MHAYDYMPMGIINRMILIIKKSFNLADSRVLLELPYYPTGIKLRDGVVFYRYSRAQYFANDPSFFCQEISWVYSSVIEHRTFTRQIGRASCRERV